MTLFLSAFSFSSVSFLLKSTSMLSLLPLRSPIEFYIAVLDRCESGTMYNGLTFRSATARPLIFSSSTGSSTFILSFRRSTGPFLSLNLSMSFGLGGGAPRLLALLPRRVRILSIGAFCARRGGERERDLACSLGGGERVLDFSLAGAEERVLLRALPAGLRVRGLLLRLRLPVFDTGLLLRLAS